MNNCIHSGRLTKNPCLTKIGDISKATFTLAVKRNYKNKDGNYDTDFVFFIAWRGTADYLCKYIKQGDFIEILSSTKTASSQKDNKTYRWQECKEIQFVSHPLSKTTESIFEDYPEENIPEDISFKFRDNIDELENEFE